MMSIKFLFIICLQFDLTYAYPEIGLAKKMHLWFTEMRFHLSPQGDAIHSLLDDYYLQYFLAKNSENDKIDRWWRYQIAIMVHIFLLKWNIEQHKEWLQNTKVYFPGTKGENPKECKILGDMNIQDVYSKLCMDMSGLFFTLSFDDSTLCNLLRLKYELLRALSPDPLQYSKPIPLCKDQPTVIETLKEFQAPIIEWLISDLMHFLPKRPKMLKYFGEIAKKDNLKETSKLRKKLTEHLGFAGIAMLCKQYNEQLSFLDEIFEVSIFYEEAYEQYFEANYEIEKWRHKIVLENYLYAEWFAEFYKAEFSKNDFDSDFQLAIVKVNFLANLREIWNHVQRDFWNFEKLWRRKFESKLNKNVKFDLILIINQLEEEKEQNKNKLLWELGPTDTMIFRAMAICTKKYVAEYAQKMDRTPRKREDLKEIRRITEEQWFLCVRKTLKKSPKSDEFMANLHLEKLTRLIRENEDEEESIFIGKMNKYRNLWKNLLDSNAIEKINGLLNEEYFSPSEVLSNLEESEIIDEFINASQEFENDSNEKEKNAKIEQEIDDSNLNLNLNDEFEEENLEQIRLRKKLLKEAKKERIKRGPKEKKIIAKRKKNNLEKGADESNGDQKLEKIAGKLTGGKNDEKSNGTQSKNGAKNSGENKKNFKNCPLENHCPIREVGIERLKELLDDAVLADMYKIYFSDNFDEKCILYLHISMLIRSIQAKIIYYSIFKTDKPLEFEEKWREFIDKNLDKINWINPQFLVDKMYFLLKTMEELEQGPSSGALTDKLVKILGEQQMIRIDKHSDDSFKPQKIAENLKENSKVNSNKVMIKYKFIEPNKTVINQDKLEQKASKISENSEIMQEQMIKIAITQFGSYDIAELEAILNQLHFHFLSLVIVKCQIGLIKCQNFNERNERTIKLIGEKFNLEESVKMSRKMLEQQKLDQQMLQNNFSTNYYEWTQYFLVRTNIMQREEDQNLSKEIIAFLLEHSIQETKLNQITEVKNKIAKIVHEWSKNNRRTDKNNLIEPILVSTGSHLMNTELDASDLDMLCVVPDYINVYDFHGDGMEKDTLHSMLIEKLPIFAKIKWIDGRTPLIRINYGNIEVDLMLVPIPTKFFESLNLTNDQIIKEMSSEPGIYALAGYRSGIFQVSLVQNPENLSELVKALKIWAKNRLVYSGMFGYLNGAALSVMATKICALFPSAPLIYLLQKFFAIYSEWNWSENALMLEEQTPQSLNQNVRYWPPQRDQTTNMRVITPKFPEQNATFNVNKFTMKTILEELKNARKVLPENPRNWRNLFEKLDFTAKFEHFAVIICGAKQLEIYEGNCGYQKTQIRKYLLEWASREEVAKMVAEFRAIPSYEQSGKCRTTKKFSFCSLWLIGLMLKPEYDGKIFNLPPIYQNDVKNQPNGIRLWSIYTDGQNLKKIDELYESKQ